MRMLLCATLVPALVALGLQVPCTGDEDKPKERLAVLDFRVGEGVPSSGSHVLAAIARDESQKSGQYDLMDREMMRERMAEKDFAASTECDDVRCLVRFGKSLDVQKIVGGFVSAFGDTWFLTMRLVDVNSGREEATFSREHRGEMEGLLGVARAGARELLGLPVEIQAPAKNDEPLPSDLTLDLGDGVAMALVLVPAGEFYMGSRLSREELAAKFGERWYSQDVRPRHRVLISRPFYLGKHEVTQAQWRAVMGNNPSDFKGDDLPVENVSWEDCQEFCSKMSRASGRDIRLPTEAEWEYACRAGSTGVYCFGDSEEMSEQYAWHGGNSDGKTHAVGGKKPNAWNLYDMHGNVSEWCQDLYGEDYYANSPSVDPTGPSAGRVRMFVYRGGCWAHGTWYCGSTFRLRDSADYRSFLIGFRVAADARR